MSSNLVALRLQLLDCGWNIVPTSPRDKSCHVVGWPVIESNEFYVEKWAWTHPAHVNTAAVGNRNYFASDIDIVSDPILAHRVQALAFEHLGYTPFIRIGLWPKRLLVYRKHGLIRSTSYKFENGDGVEILSDGRNFTVHGFHSEADKFYQWVGEANPLEDHPRNAPLVTQQQVDAFLAAVEKIMPCARASSGRGGGNADDPTRHVNADGLIDDGRERYLSDCIWRAALEIDEAGEALNASAMAARGWELFDAGAWNGDAKYSLEKQAMEKARGTLRRINSGRVALGGNLIATLPTHASSSIVIRSVTGKREVLAAQLRRALGATHLWRRNGLVDISHVQQQEKSHEQKLRRYR